MAQPLLPVAEALERVLEGAALLGSERTSLNEALGRTLSEPVAATRTQPPFPTSAMDGYAVRAADAVAGAELRLVGESAAGHIYAGTLSEGETVRIFTGAAIPPGADAVLIQENAEAAGDTIRVTSGVTTGQFVRPDGLDFRAGDVLLGAGACLSPRALGLAAATGHGALMVARRPRVAILATGDELVLPGHAPGPAQINASNGTAIGALVHMAGGDAIDLGIAPDNIDSIREAVHMARAQEADIFVTTGGASVGERDLVRTALGQEGLSLDFWRIAMRPGRPLMAGSLGTMRMIGLPGNPVSAHVCAFLFLVPLIRALLGRRDVHHTVEDAVLAQPLAANDHREDYLRARLDVQSGGLPVAVPFARQDSSMMRALAEADCLIVRPALDPPKAAGDPCRIIRFGANS